MTLGRYAPPASGGVSVIIIIILIILYFRREGTKYIISIVKRKKIGIKCITP